MKPLNDNVTNITIDGITRTCHVTYCPDMDCTSHKSKHKHLISQTGGGSKSTSEIKDEAYEISTAYRHAGRQLEHQAASPHLTESVRSRSRYVCIYIYIYIYLSLSLYIYIYTHNYSSPGACAASGGRGCPMAPVAARSRLSLGCGQMGVNANGAAAKVMISDRLEEKRYTWHLWEDKRRLTGRPQKSLCQTA